MAEFQRMDTLAETSLILGESPQTAPQSGSLAHRFTTENAREMALRANAAKKARQEQLEADSEKLRMVTPQSERLSSQIMQLEKLMDGETDAKTLALLATSHSKLFATWQVLTGTPNPGSRRVKASRPSSASVETVQVVSDIGTTGQ
jgi:hypothetical protein